MRLIALLMLALAATMAAASTKPLKPPKSRYLYLREAPTARDRCQLFGVAASAMAVARDGGQTLEKGIALGTWIVGSEKGDPFYRDLAAMGKPIYALKDMTPGQIGNMVINGCLSAGEAK